MIAVQTWITLVTYLASGATMIFMLFFLPAIIEIKMPKDAEPRILSEKPLKMTLATLKLTLTDIEEIPLLLNKFPIKNPACLNALFNIEF
jgi:hypothetical protein